jgi:hypothetical protein
MNQNIKFSMNGFRSNFYDDLVELKELIKQVLEDEYFDKDDLSSAMDQVLCSANALNCVYLPEDDSFSNMEHIFIPLLDDSETEQCQMPN